MPDANAVSADCSRHTPCAVRTTIWNVPTVRRHTECAHDYAKNAAMDGRHPGGPERGHAGRRPVARAVVSVPVRAVADSRWDCLSRAASSDSRTPTAPGQPVLPRRGVDGGVQLAAPSGDRLRPVAD